MNPLVCKVFFAELQVYLYRFSVIDTAKENCNLLIIDCDYTTPIEYLEKAQEIYVVQDLDLLKVRETQEYFRDLKSRNIDWSKLRVIFNNVVPCKITPKQLIKNGLTYYSDTTNTYTEEFERIKQYIEINLEPANYSNYIDGMNSGRINFDKFSVDFKQKIDALSKLVYGKVSGNKKRSFFG